MTLWLDIGSFALAISLILPLAFRLPPVLGHPEAVSNALVQIQFQHEQTVKTH